MTVVTTTMRKRAALQVQVEAQVRKLINGK
jgi:hypothetical protein